MRRRSATVALLNPSPEPRGGIVAVPWHLDWPAVEVRDGYGTPLDAQVDGGELVLRLDQPLPPGEDRLTVRQAEQPWLPAAAHARETEGGVMLETPTLRLWLQLVPDAIPWRAGAATSVSLDGVDVLDSFASLFAWSVHPETRAMQVDRVRVSGCDAALFAHPWRLLSTTSGPLRATATIASARFEVDHRLAASLHRRISVHAGSEIILDEAWLHVEGPEARELWFTVSYFMHAHFGLRPSLFANLPAWFAISSDFDPLPGYGFATDALVGAVRNPPDGYPLADTSHRAFAWELGSTRRSRSLHLFRMDATLPEMADLTGRAWYDLVFEPIRAWLLP